MVPRKSKNKKQSKPADNSRQQRSAQIFFAIFAVILILSMLLSAIAKF